MIGFLRGTVALLDSPYIFIDVNGVGYKVLSSASVLSSVKVGEETKVFTYTHVREDILELYGFIAASDLKLFEQLISVSGIGPKTAVGIFAIGSSSQIIAAITTGDTDFFTGVPRLGKKNAQKLIIELKNKLGGIGDAEIDGASDAGDIITILKSFGFSEKEAGEAIRETSSKADTTEQKVRLALKYLGK